MFQAMDAQSLIVLYFDILILKEVAGGRMCGRKHEEDWEEEQRRRSAPAQCWLWRWQVWWVGKPFSFDFHQISFHILWDPGPGVYLSLREAGMSDF